MPIVEKENWRTIAAEIAISLNSEEDSPLKDKLNISGKRDTGKPIQLNSFVSSLQTLFFDKEFLKLNSDDRLKFLKVYWTALKDLFPQGFDKKTNRQFMLLKALGVYSLHWLAKDVFRTCLKQDLNFADVETLRSMLTPLKSFDWYTQTSPLSGLGGMKGANKAHDLLLATINGEIETASDKQTLHDYIIKKETL